MEQAILKELSQTRLSSCLVFIHSLYWVLRSFEVCDEVRQMSLLQSLGIVHVDTDALDGSEVRQVAELGEGGCKGPLGTIEELRIWELVVCLLQEGSCWSRGHDLLTEGLYQCAVELISISSCLILQARTLIRQTRITWIALFFPR